MRKILLLILLLCGILMILPACDGDKPASDDLISESSGDNDIDNIVVSTKIPDREYFVIRSDYSPREETDAAVKLRKALEEFTNMEAKIGISTDWEKNPVYDYEFIIGTTLREKDENVTIDRISLGETGFIIKAVGTKVYIAGGDIKGTNMAVDYFINTFITGNRTDEIVIPKDYNYIQYHQYDIPELYIGDTLINNTYVIRCENEKNRRLAETLQSSVYYKTGLWLDIVSDTSRNAAFILSDTEPQVKGIYQINVDGSSIVFASSASSGLDTCVWSFIDMYINDVYGAYKFAEDFTYVDLGDYIIVTMPEGV